jgi:hypothetical protein
MLQTEDAIIRKLIIHRVSIHEENTVLTNDLPDPTDEIEDVVLKKILLKPFLSQGITFEFKLKENEDENKLFNYAKAIFEGEDFVEQTKNISKHLIAASQQSDIKDGDLFIVNFDQIVLNDKPYEGIGIYKFEEKESFIDTNIADSNVQFKFRNGIGTKKPENACLIIFTDEPYTILVIDNHNQDSDFWQKEFIKLKLKNDFVNNTNQFLSLTKKFITEQIPNDFEVSKADQIDLLNRSVDYFKTNDRFEKEEFESSVFRDDKVISSFHRFDESNRNENDMELSASFEISPQAVKKQARVFKSVLKLDKNFHIYIHGSRDLIEKGEDANGRKFYKIFYNEEH